ncbi:histamine H2 receptor-like [Oculina patagonica]
MDETENITNLTASVCSGDPLPSSAIIICASLVVLSLFILAANLTVIMLVVRRISLRTQTNFCLCSLASSDFMAGLIALPLTIACSSTTCIIPELCLAMDLCQRFLAISTIIHLLVITTERYIMIVYPMKYPRILTKSRILTLLGYTWFISLLVSLIQLAWYDPEWKETPSLPNNDLIYDIFCVTIIVLLPLVFMIYAHIHILVVARQQIRAIKRQTDHLRTANQKTEKTNAQLIYVAMLGVFITGWIPYFLLAIEADSNRTFFVFPSWLHEISLFFKFSTGLFNPLLYTYFKSDFKREVLLLYRRLKIFCCRLLCRHTKTSEVNACLTRVVNSIDENQEAIQLITVV